MILLDTQLLVWMAGETPEFSAGARAEIEAHDQACWFSVCSIWELAIKRALGRPDFKVDPVRLRRGLLEGGAKELTITSAHALAAADLPPIHKDPFDRLLIAQANVEGMTLLTSDALVAQYGGRVKKV